MNTNTNNIDYRALDELVRRARVQRSAALGELIGEGIFAAWQGSRRIAGKIAALLGAALQPPRGHRELPHAY